MNNEQIKSKSRVKKYAEVFTAEREVKAMCDLIPSDVWDKIDTRFLEPACGTGNFLIEILARKYNRCKTAKDGLKAIASIVGIDIQPDNCDECRKRLLEQYIKSFPTANNVAIAMAYKILQNNIICGDSLKIMEQWEEENKPKQISIFDL